MKEAGSQEYIRLVLPLLCVSWLAWACQAPSGMHLVAQTDTRGVILGFRWQPPLDGETVLPPYGLAVGVVPGEGGAAFVSATFGGRGLNAAFVSSASEQPDSTKPWWWHLDS